MPGQQTRKLYCNRCHQETNHLLRGECSSTYVDENEEEGYCWEETEDSYLYSCAGCEAPTLLINYSNIAGEKSTSLFPERTRKVRSRKRFFKLPPKLKQTYVETIDTYNSGCLLLCTIGLRTLLEGVCEDKKIKGDNLQQQIDNLAVLLPTGNLTTYLHGFRFSGNDAAHDLEALTKEEAANAIDVMEDLLNFLYDLDYKASLMKNAERVSANQAKGSAATVLVKADGDGL